MQLADRTGAGVEALQGVARADQRRRVRDEPLGPGELPIAALKCPAFVGQSFADA